MFSTAVSSFPRTVDASSCCVLKRLIICLVSAVIVWGHWGHQWGLSSAWGHPELSRHRSQDRGSTQLEVLPLERGPYSCVVQSGPVVRSGPRAGGVSAGLGWLHTRSGGVRMAHCLLLLGATWMALAMANHVTGRRTRHAATQATRRPSY